jgi:hypothetical protein
MGHGCMWVAQVASATPRGSNVEVGGNRWGRVSAWPKLQVHGAGTGAGFLGALGGNNAAI